MPLQAFQHALQQRLGDKLIEACCHDAELQAGRAEAAYIGARLAGSANADPACSSAVPLLLDPCFPQSVPP